MDEEEKDLIHRAQEGNNWAFEKLIRKYDRRILALALQLVGNTEDAKDVYQEVFMRVYRKLHRFRFESDFYTWLYRIAVNCAISYRKRRTRQRFWPIEGTEQGVKVGEYTPSDSGPTPDTSVLTSELNEQIEAVIETLPVMQRAVFVLRFFQEFKIKEIAQITGCSEGTVKNYLFRSTQKMRDNLSSYIKS